MAETLSLQQACKTVLHSQKLPPVKQKGSAVNATLAAIENLGYIQIDTISVIQRAHHHTLWNRNPGYKSSQLDRLVKEKRVFEYWSHAAAYLPMRDYRYSLFRKNEIKTGKQGHWYTKDEELMDYVYKRIKTEGPLMAKDFEHDGRKSRDWGSKPAKRALENLFMQGDLMISYRNNFHKVYDITERVLPEGLDTSLPTPKEYARFLILSYLRANGLGRVSEITYLLKNIKNHVSTVAEVMLSDGELLQFKVGDNIYFALPETMELLNRPLARSKLKILSPFDNLLIQRKRIQDLFNFDYQIECYLPEAKRKYGYFSLPVMWEGKLVARMDCKADRKESVLNIYNLAMEPGAVKRSDALLEALKKELVPFMEFNNCTTFKLHKISPAKGKGS